MGWPGAEEVGAVGSAAETRGARDRPDRWAALGLRRDHVRPVPPLKRRRYFTAIVTPDWLEAVPTCRTTGRIPVCTNPPGTRALICRTPTRPAALPAKTIWAKLPPIRRVTGSTGWPNG